MSDRDRVHMYKLIGSNSGPTMTEVERVDYLGVPCVKGKSVPNTPGDWLEGTETYVPVSQILAVTVFDSLEAHRTAMERQQRLKGRKSGTGPSLNL
jgi:hypothetical protein